jgi:hypothetical protein
MKTVFFGLVAMGSLFAQQRTEVVTTTTWNGTLVDAACQTTRTERRETIRADGRTQTTTTDTFNCPVTKSTTTFGLLTPDGRYIRFDSPSNTRVVEIMRSNRDWDQAVVNRTPLTVNVVGTANGDVAVVETLSSAGMPADAHSEAIFDVRHRGDRGKLVVGNRGLTFEDLSNAKRSRSWAYSEIKSLKRDGDDVKIEPHSGDTVEFEFHGKRMSDSVYQLIGDRIVGARGR